MRTTFGYDADGNVISTKNEGVGTALVNVSDAAYDVRGRITSFTDAYDPASTEPHRTTGYAYTDGANATATTTYADGTTAIETYRLDGSLVSVGGTAVTASASEHGVDSNGDTWVKTSTNAGVTEGDRTLQIEGRVPFSHSQSLPSPKGRPLFTRLRSDSSSALVCGRLIRAIQAADAITRSNAALSSGSEKNLAAVVAAVEAMEDDAGTRETGPDRITLDVAQRGQRVAVGFD